MASTTTAALLYRPLPAAAGSQTIGKTARATRATTALAMRRGDAQDRNPRSGRMVDESMIVLRRRLHEMKSTEQGNEAPVEWMDWEKRIYASYDSMICDVMRMVQSYLMETRPAVAVAVVALIGLSVPFSTGVILFSLLELSRGALSALQ